MQKTRISSICIKNDFKKTQIPTKKSIFRFKNTILLNMHPDFLTQTSLIAYAPKKYEKTTFTDILEILLTDNPDEIKWLNTY